MGFLSSILFWPSSLINLDNQILSIPFYNLNQKTHQNEIQKLINEQARSITKMYPSTPIDALISELGLIPTYILLDFS